MMQENKNQKKELSIHNEEDINPHKKILPS